MKKSKDSKSSKSKPSASGEDGAASSPPPLTTATPAGAEPTISKPVTTATSTLATVQQRKMQASVEEADDE